MLTVIDVVVSLVDQVLPLEEEDVKLTLPPSQKVVGPSAVMVGAAGGPLLTVTVVADDVAVHPKSVTVTV